MTKPLGNVYFNRRPLPLRLLLVFLRYLHIRAFDGLTRGRVLCEEAEIVNRVFRLLTPRQRQRVLQVLGIDKQVAIALPEPRPQFFVNLPPSVLRAARLFCKVLVGRWHFTPA